VNWLITLPCRLLMRWAETLVPASLRPDWREEWGGRFWQWMLAQAQAGTLDARGTLVKHCRSALRAAIQARFQSDLGREELQRVTGDPRFCISVCAGLLLAVAIASGGFAELRRLAHGLPYREPGEVVILAQGPPVFGARLGFRRQETALFRSSSHTLEDIGTYTWRTARFQSGRGSSLVMAADVSPNFFEVLGVGPTLGHRLEGSADSAGPSTAFLASYDFWQRAFHGDAGRIGQTVQIDGRPMILAGVLPRGFSFLSAPIQIWTLAHQQVPPPGARWWWSLEGAVGRLRPGATPAAAEKELRLLQVARAMARRNFAMHVTPIADLVYGPVTAYAENLAVCLGLVLAWVLFQLVRDHARGVQARSSVRFWSFFLLKTSVPFIALFGFFFECMGANQLGVTGGTPPGSGPIPVWALFCGVALILVWAWRDQPARCRVCLHRMRQAIRIGVPGHMLLDTSGEEVMCPSGHGSVYKAESVLGAEMADRWFGLEEIPEIAATDPPAAIPGGKL